MFKYDKNIDCNCCNMKEKDTIWHMIAKCKIQCGDLRMRVTNSNLSFHKYNDVCDLPNREEYKALVNDIIYMLNKRNMMDNNL